MAANVKFSQLPNLTSITANTIIPVVAAGTNYTVTTANLQTYVNGGAGNITSGNISATGNVTGGNILTTGIVSATGNITANYFLGNGSQLTGLPATYTNANVNTLLAAWGSNALSTTGNITGGNIIGTSTGSQMPYLHLTAGAQATSYNSGTLTVSGGIGATGNVWTRSNLVAGDAVANIVASATTGAISATGNITGAYFLGNGSSLTSVVNLTDTQTVVGNKSFTGTTTLGPYIETTAASVNSSTSFTPTMSNGPVQKLTATANFALNLPSGMVTGQSITLIITQDATGSRVMTAAAAYKFAYGIEILSTAANSIDVMSIFYDGTNYLCNLVKGYV